MAASQSGRELQNAEDQPRDLIDLTKDYAMNVKFLCPGYVTLEIHNFLHLLHMYSQPDTDYIRRLQQKDNTSALKLWLLQHKKNPYPSKPEKIMLAVLAKMTLTQVSTWFANARRRLKKDYPDVSYYSTDTGSHVIYYHNE